MIYTVPQEFKTKAVHDITDLLEKQPYAPKIAVRLPLDRIVEAHEVQESGRQIGKILIQIA